MVTGEIQVQQRTLSQPACLLACERAPSGLRFIEPNENHEESEGESTMNESYSVQVTKDYLVFSAAHFITFDGDHCERLHGHNYRVCVDVIGPLDENHYVIDFIALRDELRSITESLDHHMLVPTQHPMLDVVTSGESVQITFRDRRWVFPRLDCVLLDIANTTTELLARHIGGRVLEGLERRDLDPPQSMIVAVDENEGQWGRWHWQE